MTLSTSLKNLYTVMKKVVSVGSDFIVYCILKEKGTDTLLSLWKHTIEYLMIILISIYYLAYKDQIQLPEFTGSWNFPCSHPMETVIS